MRKSFAADSAVAGCADRTHRRASLQGNSERDLVSVPRAGVRGSRRAVLYPVAVEIPDRRAVASPPSAGASGSRGTSGIDAYIPPAAPSATATASRTAGSADSRCGSRAWRAGSVPIRPRAHAAADRTTGSSSSSASRAWRAGTASATRRVPRTRHALRSRPARLVLASAVPLRASFHVVAAAVQPLDQVGVGPVPAGPRAPASGPAGALRFQGQTSWQTSQPKTQPSRRSANSSAIGPLCSIVQ